ncbi:MAG: SH3 domain-containing protein, partial [Lachnospiraceae bacterium]|nr:SH3 domain-containing protein [Lachnospiraceae bacterium]
SELMIVSNVNVRDQPSTTGTNVLKVAKAGETYVCNGYTEDGTWYEIVLEDGTVGYVFHEYVSVE